MPKAVQRRNAWTPFYASARMYRYRYELRRYRALYHANRTEKRLEVVQDTAWEGYTKIPTWIQVTPPADEAVEQMWRRDGHCSPYPRLPCRRCRRDGRRRARLSGRRFRRPRFALGDREPELADCIYRSGLKGDIVNVGGDMATIMWQDWPAANLTRWAGKFCATAPPNYLLPGCRCRLGGARTR